MAVLKFLAIFVPVAAGAGLALLIALVEWLGWLLWRCLARCCGRRQPSASTSA